MILIVFGALSDFEKNLLNQIYKEYNIKLFHIAFGILHSHADAEEAVSSTFLKIVKHIEKISRLPSPQIAPYCIVIVKNEAISIIRRKRKEPIFEDIEILSGTVDNTSKLLSEQIDKEDLLKAISQLSDEERQFIYLRYVNEMNYKAIADLMGISEEAAKKRGQRIIGKLRLFFEGEYKDEYI